MHGPKEAAAPRWITLLPAAPLLLPVMGSVLSLPVNTTGFATGVGRGVSFGFGGGGIISAFGEGGNIAPVCFSKKLRISSLSILPSFPEPTTSLSLI